MYLVQTISSGNTTVVSSQLMCEGWLKEFLVFHPTDPRVYKSLWGRVHINSLGHINPFPDGGVSGHIREVIVHLVDTIVLISNYSYVSLISACDNQIWIFVQKLSSKGEVFSKKRGVAWCLRVGSAQVRQNVHSLNTNIGFDSGG